MLIEAKNTWKCIMKKITGIFLSILLVSIIAVSASSANEVPEIIVQPQNPTYNIGAVAVYSVTAEGSGLTCTWHLVYEGVDYNISRVDDTYEPWIS